MTVAYLPSDLLKYLLSKHFRTFFKECVVSTRSDTVKAELFLIHSTLWLNSKHIYNNITCRLKLKHLYRTLGCFDRKYSGLYTLLPSSVSG